jgi:dGTPase
VLKELFAFFLEHPDEMTVYGARGFEGASTEERVADFLAGMTDRFALNLYETIFLPRPWKSR